MEAPPKRRIGLFGGSFNPVHYGHLANAEAARTQAGLDEIIFVPAGQNPFKQEQSRQMREHCLNMLREAVEDNEHFRVSRVELDKPGKSYTIDTVRKLQTERPNAEYYFIIGTDLIYEIEQWREAEELLQSIGLVVLDRPDAFGRDPKKKIEELRERYGTDIFLIGNPELDLSSTQLRERVREGESIRYYTPDCVLSYIEEHELYQEK